MLSRFKKCANLLLNAAAIASAIYIGRDVIDRAKFIIHYDFVSSSPQNGMSLNGFEEDYSFFFLRNYAVYDAYAYQVDYLRNKNELARALSECTQSKNCKGSLLAFAEAFKIIKSIPNRMTQLELINAFVNTAIQYDTNERDNNLPHRSIVQAIIDGKGVCDEQAQLKLAMLEMAGFSSEDIRYVGLAFEGVNTFHAFVEARMPDGNWILNDQSAMRDGQTFVMEYNSALYFADNSAMNRDLSLGRGVYYEDQANKDKYVDEIPINSFNSEIAATYKNINHNTFKPTFPTQRMPENLVFADRRLHAEDIKSELHRVMELAYLIANIKIIPNAVPDIANVPDLNTIQFAENHPAKKPKADFRHHKPHTIHQ